jgi:hypothetical protein
VDKLNTIINTAGISSRIEKYKRIIPKISRKNPPLFIKLTKSTRLKKNKRINAKIDPIISRDIKILLFI